MHKQSSYPTPYVAHFFRAVDLEQNDSLPWPDYQVRGCWTDATKLNPFYLLRHALRIGRLYASWAMRDGRPTIAGEAPVVSFADLTLETLTTVTKKSKSRNKQWGPFAIAIPRDHAIAVGASRILSGQMAWPDGDVPWSIENEWRWPLPGKQWSPRDMWDIPTTSYDLKGLDVDDARLSSLGVIVASRRQVRPVTFDILTKIDLGEINSSHYSFVLPWSDVKRQRGVDMEGTSIHSLIERNLLDFSEYLSVPVARARQITRDFDALAAVAIQNAPSPESGETGGCWLWLLDNFHPLTRGLVKSGAAKVNKSGKYLARIVGWNGRSLRQREAIAKELARRLKAEFSLQATYFSVLGKSDPDAVPTYYGIMDDDLYFNR